MTTGETARPDVAQLERIAVGRTAEVFAWDAGRVVKLLRPAFPDRMAEEEAAIAQRVSAVYRAAPRCDGTILVGGRTGILYERIDGPTMDARLRTHPWELWRQGRRLGALHAAMHQADGHGFREQRTALHDALDRAERHLAPALAAAAHDRVDVLPTGTQLCHGDLHPGNVLLGRSLVVIDWENVRAGSPAADVARTIFLNRDSAMLDDVPAPLAAAARLVRSIFCRAYLDGYRAVRPLDAAEVAAWRLPILAARLAEGIEAERPMLTRELARLVSPA